MNKLKGLLSKDFAQLRSYKRNIIFMMILFILAMLADTTEEGLDVTSQSMIILVFGIIGITTFNYDETSKTDRFLLTMPLTKNEIVLEKYLLSIVTTIIGTIATLLISVILNFIVNQNFGNISSLLLGVTAGFLGVSLLVSIQIPCIYRWGAEKGRIQAMILMVVSIGILSAATMLFGSKIVTTISMHKDFSFLNYILPPIFVVISILFYYISYRISLTQFNKREP